MAQEEIKKVLVNIPSLWDALHARLPVEKSTQKLFKEFKIPKPDRFSRWQGN